MLQAGSQLQPANTDEDGMSVDDQSGSEDQSPSAEQGRADNKEKGTKAGRVACGRCRRLKVKCRYDAEDPSCLRCRSARQECVEAVSQRKPRRKVNTRIAHYEETIRQLQESVKQLQQERMSSTLPGASSRPPSTLPFQQPFQTTGPSVVSSAVRTEMPIRLPMPRQGINSASPAPSLPSLPAYGARPPSMDSNLASTFTGLVAQSKEAYQGVNEFITTGLISQAQAKLFFNRARYGQIASYGVLSIPEHMGFEEVRLARPLVAMCVVALGAQDEGESRELYLALTSQSKRKILTAYFIDGVRNLDITQALMLVHERFSIHAGAPFGGEAFALLANEVTLDLGMHQPTTRVRADAWDELEYERTFLGCFLSVSCSSLALRRQPERLPWTSWHSTCKARLEASTKHNRITAKFTSIPRIGREIFECSESLTPAIVRSFQQRIKEFLAELVDANHPMLQTSTAVLTVSLHEAYIFSVRDPQAANADKTQLLLSMQQISNALTDILDTVHRISNLAAYPFFVAIMPQMVLVALAKVQRHLKIDDGEVERFADLVERELFRPDGSAPRSHIAGLMVGKSKQIVRWFKAAEASHATDTMFDILGLSNPAQGYPKTVQPAAMAPVQAVRQDLNGAASDAGLPPSMSTTSYLSPPLSDNLQTIQPQGMYDSAQANAMQALHGDNATALDFAPFNMMTGWPQTPGIAIGNQYIEPTGTDLWFLSTLHGMLLVGM